MNLAPDHWTSELQFYYEPRIVPEEMTWDVWRKVGSGAERIAQFDSERDAKEYVAWLNSNAGNEVKRLKNITTIQQKQIERLMGARDAEILKCGDWQKLVQSIADNCSVSQEHLERFDRLRSELA